MGKVESITQAKQQDLPAFSPFLELCPSAANTGSEEAGKRAAPEGSINDFGSMRLVTR